MNNKYYTPKIEDFHVGFEFESNYILFKSHPGNSWTKVVLSEEHDWFFDSYKNDATDIEFRVKYLDKEDIESLGFIGQNSNSVYFKKGKYRLVHWITSNEIGRDISIFESYDGGTQEECLIRKCVVKNKSELKILLKQLNINET